MPCVLIVDDERSIRNTVSEFLRMDGYEVWTAEDADAALALMDEHAFDVVVTDIILPRVSGVTLLQRIKERGPDIQVIMMTGEPTVDTAIEAVRAGACDYLSKPVGKRELLAVVGRAAEFKTLLDDKHRLEADNRQYQEGLERMVGERTEVLRARTRQLEAVREVAAEISREMNLQSVLGLIADRAKGLAGGLSATVFLWDEEAKCLVPEAWQGYGEWRRAVRWRLGEGVAGRVAESRERLVLGDYRSSPYVLPSIAAHTEVGPVLAEPLLYREDLLGVLVVDRVMGARSFDTEDQNVLRLFAHHAAIAIENARLYAATALRAQQFGTLNSLGQALTMELDSRQAAEAILDAASVLFPSAVGQVWERVSDTDVLQLIAIKVLGQKTATVQRRLQAGEGLIGLAVASGCPVTCTDIAVDPRFVNREWAVAAGLMSAIAVPLVSQGVARGGLVLLTREAHRFSDDETALLQLFAAQAAIAIGNARLFGEAEARRREAEVLAELAHTVSASLDLDTVLQRVVDGAMGICECDLAEIALWDEAAGALRFRYWAGTVSEAYISLCIAPGQGVGGLVLESGQPFRTDNYLEDSRIRSDFASLAREERVVAEVAVPIHLESRVEGVLFVINRSPRLFTVRHEIILQRLAAHAAIAIQNARLFAQVQADATTLKARVEERTQDLARANEQLHAASRHKSAFLANMSHEIRTPLNSILGFAQVLQDQAKTVLTEKQRRFLDNIHRSGQHLLRLINDILDLSKVEAGKFVLRPEALPVGQTVEDILVIARGLANKKSQRIQADIEAGLPPFRADAVRFKQICFNLLSNAVKFTPEGGRITVKVRGVSADPPGRYVELAVADSGIGIRPGDIPMLFREFTQLETTKDQHQDGTGLGLALTKRLVELHGGQVWAESAGEGHGATFTVRLPFAGPTQPAA
jgi:signal transduction histidine kinase/FixJ family two-component response regulator